MGWDEIHHIAHQFWVLWLFIIFAAIVVWTMWPSRKKDLEEQGRIPFDDDDKDDDR